MLVLGQCPKDAPKCHLVRSNSGKDKGIEAVYVPSAEQLADCLTKGLGPAQFKVIRKLLMGW